MHVQQVEVVQFGDFGHAGRERQVVGRIVKQRIARHLDFVEMNVGLGFRQPDGLRVRDEVNVVAALRQFQAQLGGHHSAAAVGRITRDPDLHSGFSRGL